MNRYTLTYPQRRLLRFLESSLLVGDALIIPRLKLQASYVATNRYGIAMVLHERATGSALYNSAIIAQVWQREKHPDLYLPLMEFLMANKLTAQDCKIVVSGSADLTFNTHRWQFAPLDVR